MQPSKLQPDSWPWSTGHPHGNVMLALLLVDRAATEKDLAAVEAHIKAARLQFGHCSRSPLCDGVGCAEAAQGASSSPGASADGRPGPGYRGHLLQTGDGDGGRSRWPAAARAASFRQRQAINRAEVDALGDIRQHPENPALYERAARLFDSHGLKAEAAAIRTGGAPAIHCGIDNPPPLWRSRHQ